MVCGEHHTAVPALAEAERDKENKTTKRQERARWVWSSGTAKPPIPVRSSGRYDDERYTGRSFRAFFAQPAGWLGSTPSRCLIAHIIPPPRRIKVQLGGAKPRRTAAQERPPRTAEHRCRLTEIVDQGQDRAIPERGAGILPTFIHRSRSIDGLFVSAATTYRCCK